MARKDENGRIVIPDEFVVRSPMLKDPCKKNFFFFINAKDGKIGITYQRDRIQPLTNELLFLGNCDYDFKSKSFSVPENVELALGLGEDYYFYVGIIDLMVNTSEPNNASLLYIAKTKLA